MLFKILVALVIAYGPYISQLIFPDHAHAAESDLYLERIQTNGEVIGCSNEAGFDRLLSGEDIVEIAELCRPYIYTGEEVEFQGWWFFDPPEYHEVMPDDQFVAVRKYIMETDEGEIRFVWPYPLDPSDYAAFSGPFQPTPEELAEYADNPDAADEKPEPRNVYAIYL